MKKIKLFGDLAHFDTDWQLHVKTPGEALRAIEANRPGFLIACNEGDYIALLVDENNPELTRQVTMDNANTAWGNEVLMIIPRAGGDVDPISLTALFVGIGFTASAAAIAAPIAAMVLTMALSLAVSAIANVITGSKQAVAAAQTESYQNKPSFISNGPVNLLRAGSPYPILVGHVQDAGSIVLSSNYWVEDIAL